MHGANGVCHLGRRLARVCACDDSGLPRPRPRAAPADSIYRDDVTFRDPRNCFQGMKNYQLIFWSLRFHGKIFFKTLYVDVKRIWQPEDNVIKMRWTVHGIPRVPWEAEGTFDGISTYRLDGDGKIYEHSVDNILLRDPPMATNPPMLAGLNLVPSQQPAPGALHRGTQDGLGCFSVPVGERELASRLG